MEFNVQQIYWGVALVITLMQERAKKQDWAEGGAGLKGSLFKGCSDITGT